MAEQDVTLMIEGREYECPLPDTMTLGEQALFKRHAGLRIGEVGEALNAYDPEVVAVLCLIAKRRAHEAAEWADILEMHVELNVNNNESQADDAVPPAAPVPASQPDTDASVETSSPSLETAAIHAVGGHRS